MATALSNAYNERGIKEAYMMTFNNHQLQEERQQTYEARQQADEAPSALHHMKMPDPAALGRLIKNMLSSDTPLLRVIPINNGALDDEQVKQLSDPPLDVRKAFGPGFDAPKQTLSNGRG